MLHRSKRRKGSFFSLMKGQCPILISFFCGFICAITLINYDLISTRKAFALPIEKDRYAEIGSVKHLDTIPFRPTSHRDVSTGKFIMKQSFLEPFRVPNFAGFSVATFEPGQMMMPAHSHSSMHEFFFVVEGKGMIVIDGSEHEMRPNSFIHLAPGEKHGIYLPDGIDKPMKMIVFGVFI